MALVGFVAALGPIATFGITVTLEEVALLPMGALTLGFLIWVKAFRSEYLLKAAFAVYGVGFLLPLVHSEWSILAGFIVSMSYWGMALFVFWFLCNDVREKKSPTGWTFGVSFALLDIMQLVGYVLPQMGLVVPSANEGGALGVFTIAAIALAVAGAALWATEHVGQGGPDSSLAPMLPKLRILQGLARVSLLLGVGCLDKPAGSLFAKRKYLFCCWSAIR